MKNILVVGAHFDDAELGCGGSMAKWVKEGKTVFKLTLTDNETNFAIKDIYVDADESCEDSEKACKVLGVEEQYTTLGAHCGGLGYNKPRMQYVESLIFSLEIDTLLIHYMNDLNQDHAEASKICYTAGRYCDTVLMYQSNRYILPTDFYPRVFVDITDFFELKCKALQCYRIAHDRYKRLFTETGCYNMSLGYSVFTEEKERYVEAFQPLKMVI